MDEWQHLIGNVEGRCPVVSMKGVGNKFAMGIHEALSMKHQFVILQCMHHNQRIKRSMD
jgi:hypothetical protein